MRKNIKQIIILLFCTSAISCIRLEEGKTIRDLVFDEESSALALAKDFNYYTSDKRQNLLLEDFLNNQRNWPINNTNYYSYRKIENGFYSMSYMNGYNVKTNETGNNLINIDFSNDFELEVKFKAYLNENVSNPKENCTYTLGFSKNYSSMTFISDVEIKGNRTNIEILTENSSKVIDKNIEHHSPGNFDVVTLRKVKQFLIVFLNGKYIYSTAITKFPTDYFKFYTTKEAKIDYIKYDKLITQ